MSNYFLPSVLSIGEKMDRNSVMENLEFFSWCKRMGYNLSSNESEAFGKVYNKNTKKYWDHLFVHIKPVFISQNLQKSALIKYLRNSNLTQPLKLDLNNKRDLDLLLKFKQLETDNKYSKITMDQLKKRLLEERKNIATAGQIIHILQSELHANFCHLHKLKSLIKIAKNMFKFLKNINHLIEQISSDKPSNANMDTYFRDDPDIVINQDDMEENDDILKTLSEDVHQSPSEVFIKLKEKQLGYFNVLQEEILKLDRINPKFPSPESCGSLLNKIKLKKEEMSALSEIVQSLEVKAQLLKRDLIQRCSQELCCNEEEAERTVCVWLQDESISLSMMAKEEVINKIRTGEVEPYDQSKLIELTSLHDCLEENIESLSENLQGPLLNMEDYRNCAKDIQCKLRMHQSEFLDSGGLFYSSMSSELLLPNSKFHDGSSVTSSIYKELFSDLLAKLDIHIDDKKLNETISNKLKRIESLELYFKEISSRLQVCHNSSFIFDKRELVSGSNILELEEKTNCLSQLLDYSEKFFSQWGHLGLLRSLEVMDSVRINGISLPCILKEAKKNLSEIERLKTNEISQIIEFDSNG